MAWRWRPGKYPHLLLLLLQITPSLKMLQFNVPVSATRELGSIRAAFLMEKALWWGILCDLMWWNSPSHDFYTRNSTSTQITRLSLSLTFGGWRDKSLWHKEYDSSQCVQSLLSSYQELRSHEIDWFVDTMNLSWKPAILLGNESMQRQCLLW